MRLGRRAKNREIMLVFVIGAIVGLGLWIGGSWFDSDALWPTDAAAGNVRTAGLVLTIAALVVGVVYARADKSGIAAVYGDGLRYLLVGCLVWTLLAVIFKFLPGWSAATANGARFASVFVVLLPLQMWWRLAPSCRIYRRVMKHPNDYCHGCGYRLTPEQERCPECGWEVARRTEK